MRDAASKNKVEEQWKKEPINPGLPCICAHKCIHTYIHTHTCMHRHTHAQIHMRTPMHTHKYKYTSTYTHVLKEAVLILGKEGIQ